MVSVLACVLVFCLVHGVSLSGQTPTGTEKQPLVDPENRTSKSAVPREGRTVWPRDTDMLEACQALLESTDALYEQRFYLFLQKLNDGLDACHDDESCRIGLENLLTTNDCVRALYCCDGNRVPTETVKKLVRLMPRVVYRSPHLLQGICDYSFMTPEQVNIIFSREQEPLLNGHLVSTMRPEALMTLLQDRAFDLNEDEFWMLAKRRAWDQELTVLLNKTYRVWMLDAMEHLHRIYFVAPIEYLRNKILTEEIEGDLLRMLLIRIVYAEETMTGCMYQMASLHPGLRCTELFDTRPPSDDDARKRHDAAWAEFAVNSASQLDIVKRIMEERHLLIDAFKERISRGSKRNPDTIRNLLILMRTPLFFMSRRAFLSSRVKKAVAYINENPARVFEKPVHVPYLNLHIALLTWRWTEAMLQRPFPYDVGIANVNRKVPKIAERWFKLAVKASADFVHSQWSRLFLYQFIQNDMRTSGWESLGDWLLFVLSGKWPYQRRLFERDMEILRVICPQFSAMNGFLERYFAQDGVNRHDVNEMVT